MNTISVPHVSKVGKYQPFFVMKAYLTVKRKRIVSLTKLTEFGYDSERFDIIKNYQQVDWNYYRKIIGDLKKKYKFVSYNAILKVLSSRSKTKMKKQRKKPHFNFEPHNYRPYWIDEGMVAMYSNYGENNKPNYELLPPFVMESKANSYPNFLRAIDDKCSRKWNECY